MARAGISKAQVQQAQQSLMARGEHPTIDAIRIELGNTGSKTTIHRHLKSLEQQPVGLADSTSLSEPLTRLVAQLAAQLQKEGQARIDAAEALHNEQCAQLQLQLQLSQRALAAAHQQHQDQASALQAASDKLATTQASLQAELLRSASLDQALGELQLRLADKDAQIRSLEDQQRRVDTQVRQLQGQLQTLQQGGIARQEELTRLHRDNERLLAEQRQAVAQRTLLDGQLEQRDAQVQGLRAILAQAQGAGEELRRQCAERDQQLAQLRASQQPG
ncbi:DNA-binding protein [Pseudomonas sp. GZD-209]|uniref:DNA-binding protein n=1 Tax=Pseudomonas sp. GZD-209 TaxID=3404807 RepID=UPI003BB7E072